MGWIIDAFTRKSIPEETQVTLLEPDSTVMKVSTCDRDGRFSLIVPVQPSGAFILRFTCKGYQTVYKPVKVIWRKKKTSLSLGLIAMRQLSDMADRQLGEATVTATKIKFYTKNDTLVFNASAFQLQEGSMLDELIAQLPGVEMKPDGRIFVKGRYVESLLLNGRDFFKGDNTVLLDNLPAYMVQQVQVYEKESEMSEMSEMSKLAGRKVDSGKYVMDVKLKRQYAIGWLANTEWGYGTENRYLGRLFAMRYTPQSRVSAFGNLNNMNDRRKPDGNGGWGAFDPSGGLTATKRAGLDYNVYDKRERFEASGSVDVSFSDNDNVWGGTVTDFLAGGDTYESRQGSAHGSNLSVSTSHTYKYKGLRNSFSLSPRFNYYKNDNQSAYRNGMFSVQPLTEYEALMDSLFSPNWATAVGNLIKRNGEWRRLQGHGSGGGAGYSHTTASRPDFKDADTWNIRYGGHAIADLPWKMQLSTDLTMFSRRGYESCGTNADDLVWNARLSKSVLSGRLTFMVDAWDILGNLSNVSTNVNSLYRWEYFYNVIPSYALLRVVYRLDLQPKKKQ